MNRTALIVVDMIEDFTREDGAVYYPETEAIIPNVKRLISAARDNGCLIVFMQHRYRAHKYDKNLEKMRPSCIEGTKGVRIDSRLEVDERKDYVIPKRRYSAFYSTDLDLVLREHRIQNLIIAGTKTNNCINATALDAHNLAYDAHVVKDCVSTNNPKAQEVYLKDMEKYICAVDSLEDILGKLESGEL